MATIGVTFRLPSSGAPAVSPPFGATWQVTSDADRVRMERSTRESVLTPLVAKTATIPITTTQKILIRQYVSDPMPARYRWTPTQHGVYKCSESDAGLNLTCCTITYLVSQDGQTAGASFTGAAVVRDTEWDIDSARSTRTFYNTGNAGGTYVSQGGDRLVIEFGVQATAPTATGLATIIFGNPGTATYSQTSGLTTDLTPYSDMSGVEWFSAADNNNYAMSFHSSGMSVAEGIR